MKSCVFSWCPGEHTYAQAPQTTFITITGCILIGHREGIRNLIYLKTYGLSEIMVGA